MHSATYFYWNSIEIRNNMPRMQHIVTISCSNYNELNSGGLKSVSICQHVLLSYTCMQFLIIAFFLPIEHLGNNLLYILSVWCPIYLLYCFSLAWKNCRQIDPPSVRVIWICNRRFVFREVCKCEKIWRERTPCIRFKMQIIHWSRVLLFLCWNLPTQYCKGEKSKVERGLAEIPPQANLIWISRIDCVSDKKNDQSRKANQNIVSNSMEYRHKAISSKKSYSSKDVEIVEKIKKRYIRNSGAGKKLRKSW